MDMRVLKLLAIGALAATALTAPADDAEASALYEDGRKAYLDGSYYGAGKTFAEAEEKADSNAIKANSLLAQIGAWRMCELYYREFKAIEKLLTLYPEYADFGPLVEREFELGELYAKGKREPAFWALRFIPWLTDEDHTEEIFKRALERAPVAPFGATAHLRLAYIYDQSGKVGDSIAQLREIVRDYPNSDQHKYAMLALAEGLLELSRRGDGDGAYIREAADVLKRFNERYPDAEEKDWAKRSLLEAKDIQAQRLYDMAEFYRKSGREEAAERYLARVVSEFPESKPAAESEEKLVKLDNSYLPGDFLPDQEDRLPRIKSYSLPTEARRILLSPGVGDHHFMIPVYDLRRNAETEPPPAPAANTDGKTDAPETGNTDGKTDAPETGNTDGKTDAPEIGNPKQSEENK